MGRHSDGTNNYSLSRSVIAALIIVVLVIAMAIWYVAARPGSTTADHEEPDCVAGELELPVASSDEAVARSLNDAYAASHPVVRDYCVTPILVSDLSAAAVYVGSDSPATDQLLEQAGRTVSVADAEPVATQPVGVAADVEVAREDVALEQVAFPTDVDPAVSAAVATELAAGDEDAAAALRDQRVHTAEDVLNEDRYAATTRDGSPVGWFFTELDSSVSFAALPLNQTESVSEDKARAGQDFARFAAESFAGGDAQQPEISDTVWEAALPATGQAPATPADDDAPEAQAAPEVMSTLFLLDTSDAMSPFLPAAAEAIGEAARGVAGAGHSVGLWNYSSPLNPGVQKSYRENVMLGPAAEAVAAAAGRFSTGGQPNTREALSAATGYAAEVQGPVRVVLITTGTADSGAALPEIAGDDVRVSVVHIGPNEPDPAVADVAEVVTTAQTAEGLNDAVGQAVGE
ncbi:hypothetical protein [Corynebacterium timonense]|uniref:von Willebrand factor type A domain-containing protein n=1 Tax=Corynebacterium timonense TaxID=441500 RepID=A0A1H1PB68_9CORY|nr:hypothetical protein [Corynebacterium timonense]SDS08538.1 hypothetical protein SAMN04488539_0976 [Corynebacterium timonense]